MSVMDAITYPFENIKFYLCIGVINLIIGICTIEIGNIILFSKAVYTPANIIAIIILAIISLIFIFLLNETLLKITKNTITEKETINTNEEDEEKEQNEKYPSIKKNKNLTNGIKLFIVDFIYSIIISVILAISVYCTNFIGIFNKWIPYAKYYSYNYISNPIAYQLGNQLGIIMTILTIIGIIATILLLIPWIMSTIRLANTYSLKSALKINDVFKDIKNIGWSLYIKNFVVLIIFLIILLIIQLFLFMIMGEVGLLIGLFLINSYLVLYKSKAYGLLTKL
jgi:hypothetical protein